MTADIDPDAVRAFGAEVSFGKTAADYAEHRAGFPQQFFDALIERGVLGRGMSALDIGTGAGTVARGMTLAGASVTAVDPADDLMKEASRLDKAAGVDVTYLTGKAEALPMEDAAFDLAIAGQCWHWFDRPRAGAELSRVLRPGGRAVIAHFDWLPLPGSVVEATEALILRHNPAWAMGGGTGIYPAWLGDLAAAGFEDVETFSFDIDQPYTHVAWRGRIRASAGVAASLDAAGVDAFDADLAALLADQFPADPLSVPHRVWAVTACKPVQAALRG
ncbi:MAG: class I SAM-dependent methyltransferase [Pseudomonadota bacterium]